MPVDMLEVRSSPIHGRGVFAAAPIAKNDVFHVAHLLVFDSDQTQAVNATTLGCYVFHVEDNPNGDGTSLTGLAMSPISFINHSRTANAAFEVDAANRTIRFIAQRDIAQGEELTIDYGDFAARIGIE
ncbi:MAG: SET domain-containing protein-lysine N-methyltransferase [Hyphomonadaceae bacterium]